MGLDQYAYIRARDESEILKEIAYWRRHSNLQDWMEKLAEEKGLDYDTFNGVELELTWEDLERLEKDIKSGAVGELNTTGFFFGNPRDDYYREHDLQFCADARFNLFIGLKVFYNSSW